MRPSRKTGIVVASALLLGLAYPAGSRPTASDPPAARPFDVHRGALVDPVAGIVYLMNPTGGIDAAAVATGRIVWHGDGADRPLLLLDEGRLVAQGEPTQPGELPLAVLDASNGRVLRSLVVPLPADIAARIDEQLMSVFELGTKAEGSSLYVAWRHTRRTHRGLLTGRTVAVEEALVRVDLASGRVEPLEPSAWPGSWGEPLPAPVVEAAARSFATADAEGGAVPAGALSPLWAGDVVFAALRLAPDRDRTRVRRWDRQGGALRELSLATPPDELRFASADGRHLLSSAPAPDPRGDAYRWSLFSLASGERVAEATLPTSAASYFVLGSTLVYEAEPSGHRAEGGWVVLPRRLVAVSLATASTVWTLPVRDVQYHGPDLPLP